ERMSWGELGAAAERLARAVAAAVPAGRRVSIWAPNSPEWIVAMYACALAGTTLVPLNPSLVDDEARDLLARSDVSLLFTVAEYRGSRLLERSSRLLPPGGRAVSLVEPLEELVESVERLEPVDPMAPFLVQYT